MANKLKEKIIVVTGGASGIGFGIADKFLKHGVKTAVILDVDEENGKEAENKLTASYGTNRAVFIKCDVAEDLDTVSKIIIDRYKTVDILVNNAGICNENQFKKCLELNIVALVGWTLEFLKHMRKDKGGRGGTIINLASVYGFRIEPYLPVYHASKFAVLGFTRSMGHEVNFEKTDVRVVAMCPGATETNMQDSIVAWDPEDVAGLLEELTRIPPQTNGVVGEAAVKIYTLAVSGTAYVIEEGKIQKIY